MRGYALPFQSSNRATSIPFRFKYISRELLCPAPFRPSLASPATVPFPTDIRMPVRDVRGGVPIHTRHGCRPLRKGTSLPPLAPNGTTVRPTALSTPSEGKAKRLIRHVLPSRGAPQPGMTSSWSESRAGTPEKLSGNGLGSANAGQAPTQRRALQRSPCFEEVPAP